MAININMTNFYEINAEQFYKDTIDVDMSKLYQKFLPLIPAGGYILDAGCGSGRDGKNFIDFGYKVHAFDASETLAKKASYLLNQPVDVETFQSLNLPQKFDAIWACASLLHVPKSELADSIYNLAKHLKQDGVFYMSFKYGDTERSHNGRNFTDINEVLLNQIIEELPQLAIKETWVTGDARPGRDSEKWLNAMLLRE